MHSFCNTMNPLPTKVFVLPNDADVFYLPKTDVGDGRHYEGEWLCNTTGSEYNGFTPFHCHPHGHGCVFDSDGSLMYEGGIRHGVFSGYGVYFVSGETRYAGSWEAGQFDGFGDYTYKCGARYNGDFVKGMRHGHGLYTYTCGTNYSGSWRDDWRHGQGVQRSVNGTTYRGDWEDGKRHGQGFVVHEKSGTYYRGGYHDNQWHGHGEWHDPGGGTVPGLNYKGAFIYGLRAGQGRLVFSDGHTIEGQFENNVAVHVRVDYTDGSSYTGGLCDNIFEGLGEFRGVNGVVYSGGWRNGRMHGEGRMDEGDCSWTGAWTNDFPEGIVLLEIGNARFASTFASGVETHRMRLPTTGDATEDDKDGAAAGKAEVEGGAEADADFNSFMMD